MRPVFCRGENRCQQPVPTAVHFLMFVTHLAVQVRGVDPFDAEVRDGFEVEAMDGTKYDDGPCPPTCDLYLSMHLPGSPAPACMLIACCLLSPRSHSYLLACSVDLSDEWMDVDDKGVPVSVSSFKYKLQAHKVDKKDKKKK